MKTILRYGLGLLVLALTLGALTSPAEAHTGDLIVTGTCNPETGRYDIESRLTLTQSDLSGSFRSRVGTANFEGTPRDDNGMGARRAFDRPGTYPLPSFSLPGDTTGLGPWVYAFTRWSDGFTKGSDGQMKTPLAGDCVKYVPLDAKAHVTFTQPTCTAPGRLVYGPIGNATFTGTPDGTTGPADFSVTATANPGHAFVDGTSDGAPSLTFTGHIDGKRTDQECFTQPPADRQTRKVVGSPNCTDGTVTTRYQARTRTYSWDGSKYVAGAWTAWKTTKTSTATANVRQCPPTLTRGSVERIDKCGVSGDVFRLAKAYGAQYVVDGKVRPEGTWLRVDRDRTLSISLVAGDGHKVEGRAYWWLRFSNRPCPTNPGPSPHTGARQVA